MSRVFDFSYAVGSVLVLGSPFILALSLVACRPPEHNPLPHDPTTPVPPNVSLSTSDLDFGTVAVTKSKNLSLDITNEGDDAVSLAIVLTLNPEDQFRLEKVTDPFPEILSPGSQATVMVTFAPLADGEVEGRLTLEASDDGSLTLEVSLHGTGSTDPDDFDYDEDGQSVNEGDCNDADATVYVGADEVCDGGSAGGGVDNDCDGKVDEKGPVYLDLDNDGYGDPSTEFFSCLPDIGASTRSDDCDDRAWSIHPDASELCNGRDENCDGIIDDGALETFYRDRDGDGGGDANTTALGCDAPDGYVGDRNDCDDADSHVYAGAREVCDGLDNDCDGSVDENVSIVAYPDQDGDGYGDEASSFAVCSIPSGFVTVEGDCDDADPAVRPDALEVCDAADLAAGIDSAGGIDNNCDGEVDEALRMTLYRDADGDGVGLSDETIESCVGVEGYAIASDDCDDSDPSIYEGALEACDGIDNDCDGRVDEDGAIVLYLDRDGDGYGGSCSGTRGCNLAAQGYVPLCGDCDDTDAEVSPRALEVCNDVDDNCDGKADEGLEVAWYPDADSDGYGDEGGKPVKGCSSPGSAYASLAGDCDDENFRRHPGAAETCNGIDEDCDGLIDEGARDIYYTDSDGDGYGDPARPLLACSASSGVTADGTDCDDGDSELNPKVLEVCDGFDNDCDLGQKGGGIDEGVMTLYYLDFDGDGFGGPGLVSECAQPPGTVEDSDDCLDADVDAYPGADERCNGRDDDCDSDIVTGATSPGGGIDEDRGLHDTYYLDIDRDGYGDSAVPVPSCVHVPGLASAGSDCANQDAGVHPEAPEICNGIDDDCDGITDDRILYYRDLDGDGYGDESIPVYGGCPMPEDVSPLEGDCDDGDPDVYPGALEPCDGTDYNCDGVTEPLPASPIAAANTPVCQGETLFLTASSIPDATYHWSGPAGFSSEVREPELEQVGPEQSGTYSVTVVVGGCTSLPAEVEVDVVTCP